MTAFVDNPRSESERPRIGVAIAIAATCFSLGVAGVLALPTRSTPPRETSVQPGPTKPNALRPSQRRIAEARIKTPEPIQVPSSAATGVLMNADATRATTEQTALSGSQIATPPIEPKAATAKSSDLTMIQGRVAYLRCDGLLADHGRSPCPRDAALERAVWETLSALPACHPSLGRGGADVRLDISRGQGTEARVIAIPGSPEPTLDTQRVYACVGRALAKLNTTLDPLYMMVSFRVALH